MTTPRRIAWEACTWIAAISQEKRPLKDGSLEDRAGMCNPVLASARKGNLEIATSALSLVEVCRGSMGKTITKDAIESFFRNPFVLVVPLNIEVGSVARDLMMQGYPKLKPADASHVATALVAHATELHTFDDALLNLDNKVPRLDTGFLRIIKPNLSLSPMPLFEGQ